MLGGHFQASTPDPTLSENGVGFRLSSFCSGCFGARSLCSIILASALSALLIAVSIR